MTTELGARGRHLVPSGQTAAFLATAVVLLAGVMWTFAAPAWNGNYRDVRGFASWTLQSLAEPQFYVAGAAGAGLIVGGWFAHLAHRSGRSWQGFLQACGTGIWPSVAGASLVSAVLSSVLYGWTLSGGSWQPLFVPLASVAPAIVVLYGPGWKTTVTAIILGAVLVPPVAVALVNFVCRPLGLPDVVGVTGGMAIASVPAFLLCRVLPWLPEAWGWTPPRPEHPREPTRRLRWPWTFRRALADFTEAQFFGNEWASLALIAGGIVAYVLAPQTVAYGSGLFPEILTAQALTAVTAVWVWRSQWGRRAFFPTFVPVVSTTPAAVLTFDGNWMPVVLVIVLGALLAPPLAQWISSRLPKDFHPFVGNVASMALSTLILVPPVGLLLNGAA